MAIGPIQHLGFISCDADGDCEPGAAQLRNAFPAHLWIGIGHRDDHPPHAGSYDDRRTRGRTFVEMTARLQRHVQSPAFGEGTGLLQRESFGVRLSGGMMVGLADDAALRNDNSPNHRVGAGLTEAPFGKPKGQRHVAKIVAAVRHRFFLRLTDDFFAARLTGLAAVARAGFLAAGFAATTMDACAAARRAIATRKGEQLT